MSAPEITTEQLWNVKTPPGIEAIEAALDVYDALEALNAVLDAAGTFEAIGPLRRPWAFRRALETDPAIGAAWAELEARALEARRIGLTKVGGWLAPPEFDAAGHMLFEMAAPITRQQVAAREKGGPIEMLDHAAGLGMVAKYGGRILHWCDDAEAGAAALNAYMDARLPPHAEGTGWHLDGERLMPSSGFGEIYVGWGPMRPRLFARTFDAWMGASPPPEALARVTGTRLADVFTGKGGV